MTEKNNEQQQLTAEQVVQMYQQRLTEQTNIIFALVAKQGGSVVLEPQDFEAMSEKNTVTAREAEQGAVELVLEYRETE